MSESEKFSHFVRTKWRILMKSAILFSQNVRISHFLTFWQNVTKAPDRSNRFYPNRQTMRFSQNYTIFEFLEHSATISFFPSSFSSTNQLNKILGLQWQILRNAFQPLNWFTQTAGILHDDCHVGQTLICLVKFSIVQNQQRRNCLSEVAKIGMWTHF